MQVREVMTPDPTAVSPGDTLQRAAQLMDQLNVGVLPVVEDERLRGVLTDRDIVVRSTSAGQDPRQARVAEIMTDEVRSLPETAEACPRRPRCWKPCTRCRPPRSAACPSPARAAGWSASSRSGTSPPPARRKPGTRSG